MCYEEFIREKNITKKLKVKYDASQYKAINIVDEEYEGEIDLSPSEFEKISKFIKKTEKELKKIDGEEDE